MLLYTVDDFFWGTFDLWLESLGFSLNELYLEDLNRIFLSILAQIIQLIVKIDLLKIIFSKWNKAEIKL